MKQAIRTHLLKLSKKPFVRHVAMVATGTAAAQAISMAFSPIITRLYGPEPFGILGVFMSIVSILTPVAALSYPMAIVLPKSDSDARGLINLSLVIGACVSSLTALVITVFKEPLVQMLEMESIVDFLFLIPAMMFFSVILAVLHQWFIRTKKFRITAKTTVVQALLLNCSKAGFGWINPTATVLILITTVGSLLQSALLLFGLGNKKERAQILEKKSPSEMLNLAKRHRDFPFFRAPQIFINSISQGLPVLLLTSLFGPMYAGFYTLSKTVLLMPTNLIGRSVGDVFYPRIAEAAKNGENITQLITKATVSLAAASFIPFAVIIAFGPFLFGFVFGDEWVTAGEYSRWLALWLYISLLNRPSVAAIPVLGLQGRFLAFEIVSVMVRTAALGVGFYYYESHYYAISLFAVAGLLINFILILIVWFKSRHFRSN